MFNVNALIILLAFLFYFDKLERTPSKVTNLENDNVGFLHSNWKKQSAILSLYITKKNI